MNSNRLFANIFRKASVTYYYSSIFFPKAIRDDVFTLYAFVRTADDFVDQIPQDKNGFNRFYEETLSTLQNPIGRTAPSMVTDQHKRIIESFAELALRKRFEKKWIVAFLNAMKADLTKRTYKTYKELDTYMYGSAGVIGLMMARIMELSPQSYPYAEAQGKSMQLINFIRDVREDAELGRNYLQYSTPQKELIRYYALQKKAEKGYRYIPKRYLIPIKTASDMYQWTAEQITADPQVVYRRKVKPTPARVVLKLLYNALTV